MVLNLTFLGFLIGAVGSNAHALPFTIDSSTMYVTGGNVGIGTTSPAANLDVNGSVILASTTTATGAWTSWTPTVTGCSGAATINSARYMRIGKSFFFNYDVACTSNATTFSGSLPFVSASSVQNAYCVVEDNGAFSDTTLGYIEVQGSSAFSISRQGNNYGTNWTASGTKRVICQGSLEIQ